MKKTLTFLCPPGSTSPMLGLQVLHLAYLELKIKPKASHTLRALYRLPTRGPAVPCLSFVGREGKGLGHHGSTFMLPAALNFTAVMQCAQIAASSSGSISKLGKQQHFHSFSPESFVLVAPLTL